VIFRGLIIALSGFLFIFAPGLPIGLLYRKYESSDLPRLTWGIFAWIGALVHSLLLQSLILPIFGWDAETAVSASLDGYILSFINALLTAVVLAGWIYLALRTRPSTTRDWIMYFLSGLLFRWAFLIILRPKGETKIPLIEGLSIGFGAGLLEQVLQGLTLVGAGFQLLFGGPAGTILGGIEDATNVELIVGLLALLTFRLAVIVVASAVGIYVARAVSGGGRNFWYAVGIGTLFRWVLILLTLIMVGETLQQFLSGGVDLLTSIVSIVYYILVFFVGYRWNIGQLARGS
jgi:hypothetical protein